MFGAAGCLRGISAMSQVLISFVVIAAPEVRAMFIATADAKLYCADFGPAGAQPIIAIGGWIGSWELWTEPLGILSRRWRTIAYDHRGAGATAAPVESITPGRLVDDVFAVMDAHGVERCILAAESAGALTALGAVLRAPERIAGLVLVDGLHYSAPRPPDDPFTLALQHRYAATLDSFVDACVPEPGCEHIRRWGRQILARASQDAAIALHQCAGTVDLRAELSRITQPVLLLHGDADVIVPLEESQRLATLLPNAKLVVLRGAGHVPTMTRPAEVAAEIDAFFGQGET